MHYQLMQNVTTNETIRKKWNAAKKNNNRELDKPAPVKGIDKFRYIYLDKLPVSRI